MSETAKAISDRFSERFGDRVTVGDTHSGITTLEIEVDAWQEVCRTLRDDEDFGYEQLTDLCGVDYLGYGLSEWDTEDASQEGFGRGVEALGPGRFDWANRPEAGEVKQRFGVIVHLLSLKHNKRLRVRCFAPDEGMPIVPTLTDVWSSAN